MHQLLEDYLANVATILQPLPVTRRNEELKEMRQHLLNAVIVNREFGQSEAEAVASAVEQFGMPQELADNLVVAWQRGERIENRRDFWGAMACTFALLCLLYKALGFVGDHTNALPLMRLLGMHGFFLYACGLRIIITALPGYVSGLAFQKRSVAATVLAVTIWFGIPTAHELANHEQLYNPVAAISFIGAVFTVWATNECRKKKFQRRIAPISCP